MHYKKKGREKVISPKFTLDNDLLNAINTIAEFYNTTPSVVAELFLKDFLQGGKHEKKAGKLLAKQQRQKVKKIFTTQRYFKRTKKASQTREYKPGILPYFSTTRWA